MKLMKNLKKKKIEFYYDKRGKLYFFSKKKNNFNIKRVYVLTDTPKNLSRGNHARKKGNKIYLCLNDKVIIFLNNGYKNKKFTLKKGEMIKVTSMIWVKIIFNSKNSICLTIDDREYNEKEYIRNFEEFKKLKRK